jgi:hypothetical protein
MRPKWTKMTGGFERGHAYQVVSPKPFKPIRGITLTPELEVCPTHYDGRTVPCLGEGLCQYCHNEKAIRKKAYVAVALQGSFARAILELPMLAAAAWKKHFDDVIHLAHWNFTATRKDRRVNSEVLIAFEPFKGDIGFLPPLFEITESIESMWDFAASRDEDGVTKRGRPRQPPIFPQPDSETKGTK